MPRHDFPCFFGFACVLDGLGFVLMRALTAAATQVYARLSVAPVRLALDDQCERMLAGVAGVEHNK